MKPFNLKDFKSGSPAIARCGKSVYFVEMNNNTATQDRYPMVVQMGIMLTEYAVSNNGEFFIGGKHQYDIVGLK